MALIFPILTQFDDRAAKKADTTFGKLGKKFAAVFSVGAVVKFSKASVKAFQEAEKEAAQLRAQLESVNLGFAAPLLDDYIDRLELLSGRSGQDLTLAFNSLSQATGDVTTAQNLLNTALDISAATGKSLQTVASALQRGYKGETTALARLRIGYTTATLKGKDFDEVLKDLQERFSGANARATDTFAGKVARLSAAFEQAQEAFGEGFVKGLDEANVSVDELQKGIINLGEALGKTSAAFTNFGVSVGDTMAAIAENPATQAVLDIFEFLTRQGGFLITGELIPSFDSTAARRAGDERRKSEVANRATLRSRNALIKAEKKITNERKNQITQSEKDKKNAEKLAKAKAIFDLEQIQIAAALQGKLTEEERTRLKLMQAIIEENGTEADRLTQKLEKLQADTEKLATTLIGLKSGDPFEDWDDYFKDAGELLDGLLSKMKGLTSNLNALLTEAQAKSQSAADRVLTAKEERSAAYQEAARATAVSADLAASQAATAQAEALAALAAEDSPANREFLEAANAAMDAAQALAESVIAAEEAAALAEADMASMLDFEATFALLELGLQPIPNINVTVEGSVISDQDLAQVIRNESFQYQRSGGLVVFNQVAI